MTWVVHSSCDRINHRYIDISYFTKLLYIHHMGKKKQFAVLIMQSRLLLPILSQVESAVELLYLSSTMAMGSNSAVAAAWR
jgi:hypothetical protein